MTDFIIKICLLQNIETSKKHLAARIYRRQLNPDGTLIGWVDDEHQIEFLDLEDVSEDYISIKQLLEVQSQYIEIPCSMSLKIKGDDLIEYLCGGSSESDIVITSLENILNTNSIIP